MDKQNKIDLYIYIVIFILLIIVLFGITQQEKDMQEIKARYDLVQEEKMYLLEENDELQVKVNALEKLITNYNMRESYNKEDVNRDGVVNSQDLLLVKQKILEKGEE